MTSMFGIEHDKIAGTPAFDVWNRFRTGTVVASQPPDPGLTKMPDGTWVRYPERGNANAKAAPSKSKVTATAGSSAERRSELQRLQRIEAEAKAFKSAQLLSEIRDRVATRERAEAERRHKENARAAAAICGTVYAQKSSAAVGERKAEQARICELEANIKQEMKNAR